MGQQRAVNENHQVNRLTIENILNGGKELWKLELFEVGYNPQAMKSRGWEGVGTGNHWAQEGFPADGPLLK
jgi:hypothetical protein